MRTKIFLQSKLLILLVILGCTSNSYALPEDRDQPIEVSADSANINNKTGATVLMGKVKIIQGSMMISADKVAITRGPAGDIVRMTATGNPAHFSQQQLAGQAASKAWGKKMTYSISNQTITITGNARVQQLHDKFSGETIVYYMDKAVVKASGAKQRVKMIIQPKGHK